VGDSYSSELLWYLVLFEHLAQWPRTVEIILSTLKLLLSLMQL